MSEDDCRMTDDDGCSRLFPANVSPLFCIYVIAAETIVKLSPIALAMSKTDSCINTVITSESTVASITISVLLPNPDHIVKKQYLYVAKNASFTTYSCSFKG